MALIKRGKTWHTHFFVDGQRFRQSLDTSDWREAQACEKELITRASQGKLAPASQQFSKFLWRMRFRDFRSDGLRRTARPRGDVPQPKVRSGHQQG